MGSENKMNDGTSFQCQSEKPILCANGCGFFGTAATMNLCSKCYRDLRLKEEQQASAKAAVEKSMSSISPPPPPAVTLVVEKSPAPAPIEGPSSEIISHAPETTVVKKVSNRCGRCNKKVGVMGFKCKCGTTYCGSHRYPEEHECTFDFKGAGRDAIAKANPLVIADKVERI